MFPDVFEAFFEAAITSVRPGQVPNLIAVERRTTCSAFHHRLITEVSCVATVDGTRAFVQGLHRSSGSQQAYSERECR
jgi:hypothetical protein